MGQTAAYREEIERLHECFVAWYTGVATAEEFEGIERALAPDFEMVTPDGDRVERAAVVEGIREAAGREEPGTFGIDIRNVECRHEHGDHATVRYEEWQGTTDGTNGRLSTVLFGAAPDAPGGLAWLDVHETWLDDGQ